MDERGTIVDVATVFLGCFFFFNFLTFLHLNSIFCGLALLHLKKKKKENPCGIFYIL